MTHVTHQWNEHWINSAKGSTTRNLFFPTIYSRFDSKYLFPNFILTQFLTGHGKFKTYLVRFKLILDTDICLCKESVQTASHFLFDCNVFNRQRYSFKLHCIRCGISYSAPLNLFRRKCCVRAFMSFLTFIYKKL